MSLRWATVGASALVAALAGVASPATAQQSGQTPQGSPIPQGVLNLGINDSTSRRIADGMASDLLKLRQAEKTYYAAHHAYAMTVADLAPFVPTPGTVIAITPTDKGGCRAVATNPTLPGAEFEAVVPAP